MSYLKQFLPILNWLPNYKKEHLSGDVFAGLTVGVMLIPQGMAYAMIAGLPPVYGLYASIVPQLIYAILGTSRQLSVAPVAMDSLLVAAGVSVLATEGTEAYISFAILLGLIMGMMQFTLGVLRLGFITNLLSKPVINGFTSAAALIIGISQLKYFFGIEVEKSNEVLKVISSVFDNISLTHGATLFIGLAGVIIIKFAQKINKKIPGAIIAVSLSILIVYFFELNKTGVSIVGAVEQGLPSFSFPVLSIDVFVQMLPLALTIAIVAFMEAYSVSKALESKKRDHQVKPNQELIALGAANIVGSFFQSFPVSGGFSRSAVNYDSGANTNLSSVISALLVSLTLLFLTPLFFYLPHAILASVIIVAIASLIDLGYAYQLWKDSKPEFLLLFVTFLATLGVGMIAGIATGIVLSILLLMYKSAYPHIACLGRVKNHHEFRNITRFNNLEVWEELLILRVDASLTFINIQYVRDYIEKAVIKSDGKLKTIILDAGPISYLDATASQGLRELLLTLKEKNINFLMCDLIGPVRDTVHKTGLIKILGKQNIFLDLNETVRFATTNYTGRYQEYALQSNL